MTDAHRWVQLPTSSQQTARHPRMETYNTQLLQYGGCMLQMASRIICLTLFFQRACQILSLGKKLQH